jgi:hypothetical protein
MTAQLFVWNPQECSEEEIVADARALEFDMIPVESHGQIREILHVESRERRLITHELLLTCDTPIPDALTILNSSPYPALLVLQRQTITGIITPADFDKVLARSFYYSLLAHMEMLLAELTRLHYEDHDEIVNLLKPDDKTLAQFRTKIRERSNSVERESYKLDLIHNLTLEEFFALVLKDDTFLAELGFKDREQAEELSNGINVEFRRKVMHPAKPVLSNQFGIDKLCQNIERVTKLREILSEAFENKRAGSH